MFKKILTVSLVAVTLVGLSSCKGKDTRIVVDNYEKTIGEENLSVKQNVSAVVCYNGESGMTFQQTAYTIDGVALEKGSSLLATWVEIGKKLNINFIDRADYTKKDNGAQYTKYKAGEYSNVDLFSNSTTNMTELAANGGAVPLNQYLGYMPNLSKFLKSSSQVANQLRGADGNIYIAPYFTGLDSWERGFLMNVDYVKALLDDTPSYYTDENMTSKYSPNGTYDTGTTINLHYATPYVESYSNEKLVVVNKAQNGKETITVSFAKGQDIISRMKNVSVKNGANLVAELKNYIDAVYGNYIGSGKLYSQRSDIFTSASACYNADEYIALLRCAKVNPQYLCGQSVIYPFVPRSGESNRQHSMLSLTSMFGVRGTDGESGRLYFDKNGELQDARMDSAIYDGIDRVRQMYQEGLIVEEFYKGYSGTDAKSQFPQNLLKTGQSFASYDYNATQTVFNKSYNPTSYAATTGYMPILPPVANWDDGDSKTGYYQFSEDTNQLKDGGWCILNRTGRTDAELIRILTLIDSLYDRVSDNYDVTSSTKFVYGDSIADIQDYGPNKSFFRNGYLTIGTLKVVKIADTIWEHDKLTGTNGWNNFYRRYVGATQGVGHIRSEGLDFQSTSLPGRAGLNNISLAIDLGVMRLCRSDGEGFFKAVPTNWALTKDHNTAISASDETQLLNTFWRESGTETAHYSYVICTGWGQTQGVSKRSELEGTFAEAKNIYLAIYREVYANSKNYK